MPRSPRLLTTLAGVAALTAAAPAAAGAATVTLDKPCYGKIPTGSSQPIVATITGGTPNGRFQLIFTAPGRGSGSAGSQTGTFDAAGNAVVTYTTISPPRTTIDPSRGQRVDVSITDFTAGTPEQPAGSFLVSTIAISVANTPRNPRAKRAVKVSATPFAGQVLYGFITKPGSTKVLKRFKVGKGDACGYAQRRAVIAPTRFRGGSYRLYVNPGTRLRRNTALSFAFRISTTVL